MRKISFAQKEYYHIFNRGTDKRDIVMDEKDLRRFMQSMEEFNAVVPIGSIYENANRGNRGNSVSIGNRVSKLVNFVCYCVNPNHYHFLLEQLVDNGISKFMHRFGLGYTKYFNTRYERSGALFQGTFKAIHVDSNEYLLHLSAYINLNDKVHRFGNLVSKSSWEEYMGGKEKRCVKDIVLKQFTGADDYKKFAEASLKTILERKDMEELLME